jgi:hypothetical protein
MRGGVSNLMAHRRTAQRRDVAVVAIQAEVSVRQLPVEDAVAIDVEQIVPGPHRRPLPDDLRVARERVSGSGAVVTPHAKLTGRRLPVEHTIVADGHQAVIDSNRIPLPLVERRSGQRIGGTDSRRIVPPHTVNAGNGDPVEDAIATERNQLVRPVDARPHTLRPRNAGNRIRVTDSRAIDQPHPESARRRLPIEQQIAAEIHKVVIRVDARPGSVANRRAGQWIGSCSRIAIDAPDRKGPARRHPVKHPVCADVDQSMTRGNRRPGVFRDRGRGKGIARCTGDLGSHGGPHCRNRGTDAGNA